MSDNADIVREWLIDEWTAEERESRTAENNPALAALDALVAERDRVLGAYHRENDGRLAAEAEVARLREALASINGHLAGGTDLPFGARMNLRSIARAALADKEEDTDE